MIDIHSHILPSIDDGASSMEEALDMARMAVECGVHTMVATPHGNLKSEISYTHFEQCRNDFQQVLNQEEIPLTIIKGMEIFTTYEVVDLLKAGTLHTINDTRYILLEFDFQEEPWFVEDVLEELVEAGYIPIIAHPSRYTMVQNTPNLVGRWISMGAKIQMNRGSLLGGFGEEVMEVAHYLLLNQMIHFVASDCHSNSFRTPFLEDVKACIEDLTSEDMAYLLLEDNPARMIQGEEVIDPFYLS